MPDYRTLSQLRRDQRREAEEEALAAKEEQLRRQAEIDRQDVVATIFPELPAELVGEYYLSYAASHRDKLEVVVMTWQRIFDRTHRIYRKALAEGNTCAAALAEDELGQIAGILARFGEAWGKAEDRRKEESSAAA